MQTGKPNQFSLHVWSVGQWSILPKQKKGRILQAVAANFSNLPLYFLYLLLKTPIFSSSFFFKLIFSPFISLHLAPSLSRVMLLKGFLLFCNEGSWCCQHRLAASPALLFYSGPAQKVWAPRVTRLHPVNHRTFRADRRQLLLKISSFYFSNDKALTFRSHAPWNHKFSKISFHISSKHSQPNYTSTVFIPPMRPRFLFSIIAFLFLFFNSWMGFK